MTTHPCRACGTPIAYAGMGRPRTFCSSRLPVGPDGNYRHTDYMRGWRRLRRGLGGGEGLTSTDTPKPIPSEVSLTEETRRGVAPPRPQGGGENIRSPRPPKPASTPARSRLIADQLTF